MSENSEYLCTKNVGNAYFDQRLECAAPKCWLKYTTPTDGITLKNIFNSYLTNVVFISQLELGTRLGALSFNVRFFGPFFVGSFNIFVSHVASHFRFWCHFRCRGWFHPQLRKPVAKSVDHVATRVRYRSHFLFKFRYGLLNRFRGFGRIDCNSNYN